MLNALTAVKTQVHAFVRDDAGLSATEYAILFVVLIVFIVAAIRVKRRDRCGLRATGLV